MQNNDENKNKRLFDLVSLCLKNDRDAQYKLYNELSGKMYAVCFRYSKDREEAEDILQEGFVKVFKNLDKFRNEGSFEGWVRRIMVNTAVEHYRKTVKMYPIVNFETAEHDVEYENISDNLELEELLNSIQKLSLGYRTVFNMYVIEGFSHKEIAEKLNISEGTSKSQLSRARQILIDEIKKTNIIKQQRDEFAGE